MTDTACSATAAPAATHAPATAPRRPVPAWRRWGLAVALTAAVGLSGCGGGWVMTDGQIGIDILVSGQIVDGWSSQAGGVESVSLLPGQSVRLDAGEAVVWSLQAGGTVFPTRGATIYYGGVYVTATAVGSSRVQVDTSATTRVLPAVPVRLVATSTWDGAIVSTVDLYIGG